ncbi:ABC transporter permease [Tenuibacillus multivorans]|uniref:ABC-2 type transport system permease protein n=1 Tax=Tenuibacillus multivorans TaxID=237069 RepID=A0A1H0FZ58_9BACI|nr:ABC transporter permease subunit [Tenuibacillus multivorans]GEL78150.1 membrane protein [Tenuibacillus multivorans]SDN99872.1 ABC-2 type transport system permease protein [Tenuibacillus multivorans]
MQWYVIFKKEILENWRNMKWIWVPIVFILFAVMDPITTYYLPKIMDAVGGIPEGAVVDIPMPNANEAILMSFNELGLLGVLITVVIAMGVISGEMKSGVYELILSKPVKYTNYVSAKFMSLALIVFLSIFLAVVAGWYYVSLLFGSIDFTKILTSILFFSLYFALIIGIVIMVNTWVQSPGVVAFLSLIIIIALNVLTSIYGHIFTWSPALIGDYIGEYLHSGVLSTEIWYSALMAVIFTFACIQFAILTLKNRALQ